MNVKLQVVTEIDAWVRTPPGTEWPKVNSTPKTSSNRIGFGTSTSNNAKASMRHDTYEMLVEFYKPRHNDLEELLGRKITGWSYLEDDY